MNYFQITIDPKVINKSVLQQCLQDLENSEVVIERKEKFDENYPLEGYNIYLKSEEKDTLAKWTKKIIKVEEKYKTVTFRYRLKGWTY